MYNKLCTRINLKSTAAPNGYYPITKCNTNTSPITRIDHNGDVYDFGRIADDESGVLNHSLYQKLVSLKLQGNSTQAASSVPKYTCRGKSVVYKFVDYIESSGTQYIDTGVKLNQSSRVQLKYQYVGTPSSARVFGDATDPNRGWMITTQNGSISTKIQTLYGDDWRPTQSDPESAIPNNDIVEYERNGANQYVNGELYYTNNASTFQTSDTAKIFGAYYLNMALSSVRVYGCKIWNDGTLVRDFVPAYDGNGTIGLFDKVNEKFYTNAGTGTFSKGTDTSDGAISSISSITLGGQTVSVDLRSAGSVYDEWASNSRGTRKCVEQTYDATGWSWNSENSCYVHAKPAGAIANQTNFLLSDTRYTIAAYELVGQTDFAFLGYSNINIRDSRYSGTTDLAAFSEYISGLTIVVALTSGNYQAITSTPLTLASGLTPTDQDGNAVTFTEGTESTPSPNYPEPITNSTLFSIKSNNVWDEQWESGAFNTANGEKIPNTAAIRSKNYIPVKPSTTYTITNPAPGTRMYKYGSDYSYVGTFLANNTSFTTDANTHFLMFNIGNAETPVTTYGNNIDIFLFNSVAVDIAGLTNKDELYVNVESTNIWDEEWEIGGIDTSTGQNIAQSCIRSKNYIEVTPGGNLNIYVPDNGILYCYDEDYSFISGVISLLSGYNNITLPANCHFIRFRLSTDYGTSYHNDISISIGSSPVPYMPHDTQGKVWKKQQVGRVDLSSLSWSYGAASKKFYATLNNVAYVSPSAVGGILCTDYIKASAAQLNDDPYDLHCAILNGNEVQVKNLAYINPTTFGNDQSGAILYYPLATPTWTDISSTTLGTNLLALYTDEADSLTISIDNSGTATAKYWRQV